MRPEFRSTRSARVVPSLNSISKFKDKKAHPPRPVSSPHAISSDSILEAFDSTSKKQSRHRMTDEQLSKLDTLYERNAYPTKGEKQSLGKEVGLEVKTVSIWFQNKRQTEKKAGRLSTSSSSSSEQSGLKMVSSPSRNTTIGKRTRPPHYSDKYHDASSRRKPLLSGSDDSRSTSTLSYETECDTPRTHAQQDQLRIHQPTEALDDNVIPPYELWKHLLSSSPTMSEESQHLSADIDTKERSTNVPAENFIDSQGSTVEGSSKRSRMLDWVCDRQAKRRRNNRDDPADPAELISKEDTDNICPNCLRSRRPDFDAAFSLLMLPGDPGPSEDVMRAASLLLCLKYSAQNPRQGGHT